MRGAISQYAVSELALITDVWKDGQNDLAQRLKKVERKRSATDIVIVDIHTLGRVRLYNNTGCPIILARSIVIT